MPRRTSSWDAIVWSTLLSCLVAGSGGAWAGENAGPLACLRRPGPCPPGYVPVPSAAAPAPAEVLSGPSAEPGPGPTSPLAAEENTPPADALASAFGAAQGPVGAPNVIGDLLGGAVLSFAESQGFASAPIAGGAGLFKTAENNSPIPTDRVFFNFSHYHRALVPGGSFSPDRTVDLNRYTFGVEKAFLDNWWSLEARLPFAAGLNAVQPLYGDGAPGTEFGNIPLVFKTLLREGDQVTVAAGLAAVFPTARDAEFAVAPQSSSRLFLENDAVHLQPFVGALWLPADRWFVEGFAQVDFACSGNDVAQVVNGRRDWLGAYQDQNVLMLDVKLGYWLHRNPHARILTGIVPTVELHYTSTLQDSDVVEGGIVGSLSNPYNRVDILDLTAGLHFQIGALSDLTVAGVAPLRTTAGDKQFDSEILVQLNRRF